MGMKKKKQKKKPKKHVFNFLSQQLNLFGVHNVQFDPLWIFYYVFWFDSSLVHPKKGISL